MDSITKFLIKVVKDASLLITNDFDIKIKSGKYDLVTNMDCEVEKFIIEKIKSKYLDFDIISEEYNNSNKLTENCFVIDPIDGTVNFVNGTPFWGIQVACIKDSNTISAVLYLPKLKELYYADKSGAFLNNKSIHVNNMPMDKLLYCIEGKNRLPSMVRMKQIVPHTRTTGSTCVNFAWVARGYLGGTIFKSDTLWDYIPGQFLVQQAGGYIINNKGAHIATNSKEFAELLNKKAGFFANDTVTTKVK